MLSSRKSGAAPKSSSRLCVLSTHLKMLFCSEMYLKCLGFKGQILKGFYTFSQFTNYLKNSIEMHIQTPLEGGEGNRTNNDFHGRPKYRSWSQNQTALGSASTFPFSWLCGFGQVPLPYWASFSSFVN
uniref:Uncharacterized protein n=1 Tax=Macaca fascicularis TaxID=9541 RepID=Q9GKW5_MACFA|nr:hypothetical protein [Macaca fascicularis]